MLSPTIANTLGSLQISLTFSLALLGASSLQCHYYFEHYGSDRKSLKALVLILWVLEVVHAVFMFHAVYVINVNGFGSKEFLTDAPWSVKLLIPASAILDIIVESCFAYRVRLLSRRWLIPTICWILIAIRAGAVMFSTDLVFKHGLATFTTEHKYVLGIALGPLVVIDFLIASSLFYWLSKIRSGFPSSDQVVNRLIVFAFECGAVWVCLGLLTLITAMVTPDNYIWLAALCIHSKVYSNAFLLSLNRRHSMSQTYGDTGRTRSELDRVAKLFRFPAHKTNILKKSSMQQPIIDIYSHKGKALDPEVVTNTSQQLQVDKVSMHS